MWFCPGVHLHITYTTVIYEQTSHVHVNEIFFLLQVIIMVYIKLSRDSNSKTYVLAPKGITCIQDVNN